MVKKLSCICLLVILILSSAIVSYAYRADNQNSKVSLLSSATKLSKDDAVKIAITDLKDYFGIDLNQKLYRFEYRLDGDVGDIDTVWNFHWNPVDGKTESIYVAINATNGSLLLFDRGYNNDNFKRTLEVKYNQDQSKEIIEKVINKIVPEKLKNTKLTVTQIDGTDYSNSYYEFTYNRYVNGVKFSNNNVQASFDYMNGKIMSYSCNWDDTLKFPDKSRIIDQKKVTQVYKSRLKLGLKYIDCMDDKSRYYKVNGIKLVYVPDYIGDKSGRIDAKNPENFDSPFSLKTEKIDLNIKDKVEFVNAYKRTNDKELNKAEAEKLISEKMYEIMAKSCKISNLSYYSAVNNNGEYRNIWTAKYRIDKEDSSNQSVTIDAQTGDITNLSSDFIYYKPDETFTPRITWKQAYAKAIDIVKKCFPDKVKDLVTEQTYYEYKNIVNGKEVPEQQYGFNFNRKVNGVEYNGNGISIDFDTKSGRVVKINCNWNDKAEFQRIETAISGEKANKIFLRNINLSLEYEQFYNRDGEQLKSEVKLYYVPNYNNVEQTVYIDAVTGKVVNMNGNEIDNDKSNMNSSIKNSKYEKDILSAFSAKYLEKDSFEVNKEVTKLDLIKALVLVNRENSYSTLSVLNFTDVDKSNPDYDYIQKAVALGIINNEKTALNLGQKLTREELIKDLIEQTPVGILGPSKSIFTLDYSDKSDISADKFGYIAIAKGLGVIDDSIKQFKPKDEIHMDEFAHYLMKTAKYINYINTENATSIQTISSSLRIN